MNVGEPAAVLAELRGRGVQVVAEGDRVRFRPATAVDGLLRERIRRCKPQLLELLRTPVERRECDRSVPCRCCGSLDFWALATIGHWVCGGCHAPDFKAEELRWVHVRPLDEGAIA